MGTKTMESVFFVLSSLVLVQGVWCAPAETTVTAGTKLSEDFNKNLALILSNIQNGVTGLAKPPIKFGVDTVPSAITYGVTTAAEKAAKLANANQEAFGNIVLGASHALGGGAVMGSSIAGGAMKVAGHGLDAANTLVGTGAKVGVDLAGKVADHTAGAAQVVGTVANSALTGLGDGMIAVGSGASLLSQNLANVIDTIGGRLSLRLTEIKTIVANLMDSGAARVSNGVLTFNSKSQTNLYNMLMSYIEMLAAMQKYFDSFTASMSSMGVTLGTNTATSGSGTATTGAATTGAATTGAATTGAATSGAAASGTRRSEASASASVGLSRPGASQSS